MAGCSSGKDEPIQTNPETENIESIDSRDFQQLVNTKVITSVPAIIYQETNGEMKEVGKAEQGVYLDIQDGLISEQYLPISGTTLYVNGKDVQSCDRWFKNQTHFLAVGHGISTFYSFHIVDIDG